MKRLVWIAISLFAFLPAAHAANDINQLQLISQSDFRLLSEDLGAALSYKAVTPAKPLGLFGFDVGVEVSGTHLANSNAWAAASSSGSAPSTLLVPKLHAHLGLPLGFDVGAFVSAVPSTNIRLLGAEVDYALLKGGLTEPALAIRGNYTRLSGVNELSFDTTGVELAISKGFALFTPYAGVGHIWVSSDPNVSNLTKESFGENKVFLGGNLNLGLINFALEGDRTGSDTTVSAKLGWRF